MSPIIYSPPLIALAVLICSVTCYAAMDMLGRVRRSRTRAKSSWLLSGACVLATGIWATHFVSMMALELPFVLGHEIDLVLMSWLAGLVATLIVFYVASRPTLSALAILGAGTGLGMARGVKTVQGLQALASEGGHREFAPRTEEEWALASWLKRDLQLERLSLERVVSGTGLGHIAHWLLQTAEATPHPLQSVAQTWRQEQTGDLPARVSEAAGDGDPLMQRAREIWLGAYADGVIHQLELQDPPADLRPLLEREWTVRWVRDHIS